MAEDIEQKETVPSEEVVAPVDEVSEEKKGAVEEPTAEESKEKSEPVIEEKPTVDEETDEPAEEPVEEPKEDKPVEEKEDNVKKIDEQLAIISEVRNELANSYKAHTEDIKTIESLRSEVQKLAIAKTEAEKQIEQLTSLLDSYKAREAEAAEAARIKRLEQLSGNFSRLGQKKSVEQLMALPQEVIEEFESVTAMALDYKSEEKLDSVTKPTQSTGKIPVKEVKPVAEKISDKDFLAGVLNTLAEQQGKSGSDGKRILTM